jgi:hypothetical protein
MTMSDPKRLEPRSKEPAVFPTVPATAAERIKPFPWSVDLGTFVVGSSHPQVLVEPDAPMGAHADAIVSRIPLLDAVSHPAGTGILEDAQARARRMADAFSATSPAQKTSRPIAIRFAPELPGRHQAEINVLLRWSDGLMDLRSMRVYANARHIDAAPANPIEQEQPGPVWDQEQKKPPTANLEGVREPHKADLSDAEQSAFNHATTIADSQRDALATAQDNANAYDYKEPSQPAWFIAAEIALVATVGGVAGLAARFAAQRLAGKLSKLTTEATKDQVNRHKHVEALISDTVKDGLKHAVRSPLVKAAFESESKEKSPNGAIEFFARQRAAVTNLAAANRKFIQAQRRQLQHELASFPETAVAKMEAIAEALEASTTEAGNLQQMHSEHAWVSLLAKSGHKTSEVEVNGTKRKTTKLAGVFHSNSGVLMIHASIVNGVVVGVSGAELNGVSGTIAERLRTQDLSRAPIPLLVKASGNGGITFITRDETGRVRVTSRNIEDEKQVIHPAEQIIAAVLARSLAGWGVRSVKTDDATKYGEKGEGGDSHAR